MPRLLRTYIVALHAVALAMVIASPAHAQVGQIPTYIQPAPSGGGSPTITPGASVAMQNPNFGGTTATFAGLNGGVNFPSGAVVYVGFGGDQASTTLVNPKIGGQAATLVSGASDSTQRCQMFRATMPASEPDTFTIDKGNAFVFIGVASVYFTNITATPTGTATETFGGGAPAGASSGTDPQFPAVLSSTATIPSTGFGWAFVWAQTASILTGNTAGWQTSTPSFITAGAGDTNSVLNAKGEIASGHTTAALAGATSWQPKVSGSSTAFSFGACMGAIAVGP